MEIRHRHLEGAGAARHLAADLAGGAAALRVTVLAAVGIGLVGKARASS